MRTKFPTRMIPADSPITLRELILAVRTESRDDLEAAHVINDLLLRRRVWFVEELDQEEIRLLHS